MKQLFLFTILLVVLVYSDTVTSKATFISSDGKRLEADLLYMKNDTLYVSVFREDSTVVQKKVHKSIFTKVILASGEELNLSLSDYPVPQKDTASVQDPWQNIGEVVVTDTQSVQVQVKDGGRILVAIAPFEALGSVDDADAALLTERFGDALLNTDVYRVLEWERMSSILAQKGFTKTDSCKDTRCLTEMGKIMAVQKVISGTIGKVGAVHTATVKILDVASGTIEKSVSENCTCPIEFLLVETMNRVAAKIAGTYSEQTDSTVKSTGLFINTIPRGAEVYINGNKENGSTPVLLKNMTPGKYFIYTRKMVDSAEWSSYKSVSVLQDSITQFDTALTESKTMVQIISEPEKAELYFGETREIGRKPWRYTPVILEIDTAGLLQISLFKIGYRDTTLSYNVKKNTLNQVYVRMEKLSDNGTIAEQELFDKKRDQRRTGRTMIINSILTAAISTAFFIKSDDYYDRAIKYKRMLDDPAVIWDPGSYNIYKEKNKDYTDKYRAILAGGWGFAALTGLLSGIGFVLYF